MRRDKSDLVIRQLGAQKVQTCLSRRSSARTSQPLQRSCTFTFLSTGCGMNGLGAILAARAGHSHRGSVCVCVSNPGQRVFHHHSFHFTWAGGHGARLQTVSNKAMQSGGISSLASWTYLLVLSQAVTPLFRVLLHGPSCFHPQTSVLQLT